VDLPVVESSVLLPSATEDPSESMKHRGIRNAERKHTSERKGRLDLASICGDRAWKDRTEAPTGVIPIFVPA
jgi:hypothetical protein